MNQNNMNPNKLKLFSTAILIVGLSAFAPPRKCAVHCRESAVLRGCTAKPDSAPGVSGKADPKGAIRQSAPAPKTTAPAGSKGLAPGQMATEKKEAPEYSPFLAPLYV